MGPPLTPASASRHLAGRLEFPSTYRPLNLNPIPSPRVETPDHVNHLFSASLTGFEDGTLDSEVATPDNVKYLFNSSLLSVARSPTDAQAADSTIDEAVPMLAGEHEVIAVTDTEMQEDDQVSMSSPFNPTSTSTPHHIIEQSLQIPDSPLAVTEHNEEVIEHEELVAERDEGVAEHDETTKALLAKLDPATFTAKEISAYNGRTANPDCAACTERVNKKLMPVDAVTEMLSTYQKALVPLRDLDDNCHQDFEDKVKLLTEKIGLLTKTSFQFESEVHALKQENYNLDDEIVNLKAEGRPDLKETILELKVEVSDLEEENADLRANAKQDATTIQLLLERIGQFQAQLEAKDMAVSNNPEESNNTIDQNHMLKSNIAKSPNKPANSEGRTASRNTCISSRTLTNKGFAAAKSSSQVCSCISRFPHHRDRTNSFFYSP
jgi:hypothetical protein